MGWTLIPLSLGVTRVSGDIFDKNLLSVDSRRDRRVCRLSITLSVPTEDIFFLGLHDGLEFALIVLEGAFAD